MYRKENWLLRQPEVQQQRDNIHLPVHLKETVTKISYFNYTDQERAWSPWSSSNPAALPSFFHAPHCPHLPLKHPAFGLSREDLGYYSCLSQSCDIAERTLPAACTGTCHEVYSMGQVATLSSQVCQSHPESIPVGDNSIGQQMRLEDKPQVHCTQPGRQAVTSRQ